MTRLIALPALLLALFVSALLGVWTLLPFGGDMLAVSVESDDDKHLYLIDDNGLQHRLIEERSADPVWSADGERLAFATVPGGARDFYHIAVMDVEGGDLHIYQPGTAPAWSPDDDYIAYARYDAGYNIHLMHSDGTAPRRLTRPGIDGRNPQWLPSSGALSFTQIIPGEGRYEFRLMTQPLDGGEPHPLLNLSQSRDVTFSPDEARMAYSNTLGMPLTIFIADADGGNPRQLIDAGGLHIEPAWSSDGEHIAFVSTMDDGQWDLYVIDADGRNLRRLTNDDAVESSPAWRP